MQFAQCWRNYNKIIKKHKFQNDSIRNIKVIAILVLILHKSVHSILLVSTQRPTKSSFHDKWTESIPEYETNRVKNVVCRAVHDYHHHNMAAAASYSGLLLGGARSLGHHSTHHAHAAASYKDWTSATPSQALVDATSTPPYPHGPYAPLSGEYWTWKDQRRGSQRPARLCTDLHSFVKSMLSSIDGPTDSKTT